ncbi:MAG: hypothetical protein RBJ76_02410 [Stenomitos frigidus ULC029]
MKRSRLLTWVDQKGCGFEIVNCDRNSTSSSAIAPSPFLTAIA